MVFRRSALCIATVFLLTAQAEPPGLSTEEIAEFVSDSPHYWSYDPPLAAKWDRDLRKALRSGSFDEAIRTLASQYGVTTPVMRDLARLWIATSVHQYEFGPRSAGSPSSETDEANWTGMPADEPEAESETETETETETDTETLDLEEHEFRAMDALPPSAFSEEGAPEAGAAGDRSARADLLALIPRSGRAPLVIEAVTAALDMIDECSIADFDAVLEGSTEPVADAWRIADAAACTPFYLRAADRAPGRNLPMLIRVAHYGSLLRIDALALYEWLTSDAALARAAPADRPALSALLFRRRAELMFDTGLTDEAVSMIDGLSPDMRARVISPETPAFTAVVDGMPIAFDKENDKEALRFNLSAAYFLAGRTDAAEDLMASSTLLPKAREAQECLQREHVDPNDQCSDLYRLPMDMLVLDHLLHHPGDDPYPLAELLIGSGAGGSGAEPVSRLYCRVFDAEAFPGVCSDAREKYLRGLAVEPDASQEQNYADIRGALDSFPHLEGAKRRDAIIDRIRAIRAAEGGAAAEPRGWRDREAVTPEHPDYAEQPLPPQFRGPSPEAQEWPQSFTKLDDGYFPVRFERKGDQVVAVSISQNLDPTGEVTGGGYSIHISRDGGRSWGTPLYTGLAEGFPYVVSPTSNMPLLAGDTITLAVDIAEIDTRSITYPPVGLKVRREAKGLYLTIPLSRLRQDSDDDGIPDVVAKHLLLDRARPDGGTPFIVGSTPPDRCHAPVSKEKLALMAVLRRIFSVNSGAIVAPRPGQPGGHPLLTWRNAAQSWNRPILIQGDPADFTCLKADRLMVVYSAADVEQLQRHAPDFRTITLPKIVYNRARDRGYVIWSAGWAGGTFRMRLVDGEWVFDTISQWIT